MFEHLFAHPAYQDCLELECRIATTEAALPLPSLSRVHPTLQSFRVVRDFLRQFALPVNGEAKMERQHAKPFREMAEDLVPAAFAAWVSSTR